MLVFPSLTQAQPPSTTQAKPAIPSNSPPQMPPAVRQAAEQFEKATRLHRERKLPQAIAAYQEYLRLAQIAKLPPTSLLPAYRNLGLAHAAMGNFQAQAEVLRQANQSNPNNPALLAELANIDASQGRTEEAKKEAEQLLRLKPNPLLGASAHFTLGLVALSKNDLAGAESAFVQSAKLVPQNPQTQMNLAITYAREKKIAQAEAAAKTAKSVAPKLVQPHLFLASLYSGTNRLLQATQEYEEALRLDPKNTAVRFERSLLLQRSGKLQEALKGYLQVIAEQPNNFSARLNAGQLYYGLENYRASKLHYNVASQIEPKDIRSWIGLGLCEMQEASLLSDYKGRTDGYRRSEAFFKKAVQLAPNEVLPQEGLAFLYEKANRYDEAEEIIRKRMAKEPDSIRYYYTMTRLYKAQRRADDVVKVWEEYRTRKPQEIASYAEAADVLELADKKQEALKQWDAYLKVRPNDSLAFLQKGRILTTLKQVQEAKQQFEQALEVEKNRKVNDVERVTSVTRQVEAMRGLAALARTEQKYDAAILHLQKAKEIDLLQARRTRTSPSTEVMRDLANTYKAAGKTDLAMKEYDDLSLYLPLDTTALTELARLEEGAGRLERAANVYRRIAIRERDQVKVVLDIGMMYRRNNKIPQEIAEYERAIPKYPKDSRLFGALASACEVAQQDEKALTYYRRYLQILPKEAWVKTRLTTILTRLKRYAEARAIYEQMIEAQPFNEQFYGDLLQNYVLENRRPAYLEWVMARLERSPTDAILLSVVYEEVEKQKGAEKALAFLNDFGAKRKANRKTQEACIEVLQRHYRNEEALLLLREVAGRYPNDSVAEQALIAALDKMGKKEEATQILIGLTKRKDLTADIRVGFVRQLAMRYLEMGEKEKAFPLLQEVVKVRADDYQALSIVAQMLQAKGREEELIPIYTNIIKSPAYPVTVKSEVRKRLGAFYEKKGNKQEAIAQYKAALELTPDDAALREALKRLGAL